MSSPAALVYVAPAIECREAVAAQLMADSSVTRSPTWRSPDDGAAPPVGR